MAELCTRNFPNGSSLCVCVCVCVCVCLYNHVHLCACVCNVYQSQERGRGGRYITVLNIPVTTSKETKLGKGGGEHPGTPHWYPLHWGKRWCTYYVCGVCVYTYVYVQCMCVCMCVSVCDVLVHVCVCIMLGYSNRTVCPALPWGPSPQSQG